MIDFYEKIKQKDFLNKKISIENFNWGEFSSNANILNNCFPFFEMEKIVVNRYSFPWGERETFDIASFDQIEYQVIFEFIENLELICFVKLRSKSGEAFRLIDFGLTSIDVESALKTSSLWSSSENDAWKEKRIKTFVFEVFKDEKEKSVFLYSSIVNKYVPEYLHVNVEEISDDMIHLKFSK